MSNRISFSAFPYSLLVLAMTASAPALAQQAAEPLTDGQILQIVHTLNDGEIDQAKLAMKKSDDAQVKAVAQMITTDHESSNDQIDMLEDDNDGLDQDDSANSELLEDMAEKTADSLEDLDAAEFDCFYLAKQIEQHEKALNTLKTDLMPAASNTQLKAFLTMSGPKLEHHLQMAKAAQQGMSNCAQ